MKRNGFSGWLLLTLILLLSVGNSQALVVGNTSFNATAPSDGSPWDNVGTVNGGSGVYLGNGWVLTANHVGAGPITLGDSTFNYDGYSQRLINPFDQSQADLLLFHLSDLPSLSTLTLSSVTPSNNSLLTMIGYGVIRGSDQKDYSGGMTGYDWSLFEMKSWGTNRMELPLVYTTNLGNGTLSAFTTSFTQLGSSKTTYEAQAAMGDSGGGVFYFNGSKWELTGIMDEISTFEGQPPATAVYGNETYSADIATYKSQIESIIAIPEPSSVATLIIGLLSLCLAPILLPKHS